jgi:hypothetical protein
LRLSSASAKIRRFVDVKELRMRPSLLSFALAAGIVSLSCGGSSTPAGPSASPSPSTEPRPSPTPSATPTPEPAGLTCTVPPVENPLPCNPWSKPKKANFLTQVFDAIHTVQREKPEVFEVQGNDVVVVKQDAYMRSVVKVLERDYGLCAAYDVPGLPKDEISVKNSNDFSEQFDILTGQNTVWWNWAVTCRPAVF